MKLGGSFIHDEKRETERRTFPKLPLPIARRIWKWSKFTETKGKPMNIIILLIKFIAIFLLSAWAGLHATKQTIQSMLMQGRSGIHIAMYLHQRKRQRRNTMERNKSIWRVYFLVTHEGSGFSGILFADAGAILTENSNCLPTLYTLCILSHLSWAGSWVVNMSYNNFYSFNNLVYLLFKRNFAASSSLSQLSWDWNCVSSEVCTCNIRVRILLRCSWNFACYYYFCSNWILANNFGESRDLHNSIGFVEAFDFNPISMYPSNY